MKLRKIRPRPVFVSYGDAQAWKYSPRDMSTSAGSALLLDTTLMLGKDEFLASLSVEEHRLFSDVSPLVTRGF